MAVTLVAARRQLGPEIGPYGTFTALSGSANTFSYSSLASTVLPDDHLAYQWAYSPASSLPRLRRVTATGLNGGTGVVTLDGGFGTAVAASTIIELSSKMPPARDGSSATIAETTYVGLNECIQWATRQIEIEDDSIRIPLVYGQHDYSLSPYEAWLDRAERILDVREPNALGTTTKSTPRRWELRRSPTGHYLHIVQPWRFTSGLFSLTLVVRRPSYTLINGVEGTTGLVQDVDECGCDPEDLVKVAKIYAYRSLRDRNAGAEQATYAKLAEEQDALARDEVPGYSGSRQSEPVAVPA